MGVGEGFTGSAHRKQSWLLQRVPVLSLCPFCWLVSRSHEQGCSQKGKKQQKIGNYFLMQNRSFKGLNLEAVDFCAQPNNVPL